MLSSTESSGGIERMDNSWAHVALARLRERNKVQTDPFVDIFQSHTNLWYENARIKSLLSDVKHQLAIVQHETVDAILAAASEGPSPMLENLKLKLSQVQSDLREKGSLDESEKKKRIDLSKKVHDQEKLISDQREEIVIAKTELASALSRISELEEDLRIEKGSSKAVAAELESVRELYRKEQAENQQLLERILVEKMKTAEAMNDMMSGKTGEATAAGEGAPTKPSSAGAPPSRRRTSTDYDSYASAALQPAIVAPPSMSYWIQAHEGEVNDVKMSQDGEFLVSGCSDGTVKVFDTALGGKSVCAWSVSSPVIRLDVYRGSSSGSGGSVSASAGSYGDGSSEGRPSPDKGVGSAIFSSIRAAISQSTGAAGMGANDSDAKLRARSSSSSSASSGAAYSPDSRCWVLAGCSDGMCKIWQVGAISPVQQLQCHTNKVLACNLFGCHSGIPTRVVTGSSDRSIKLWDITRTGSNTAVTTMKVNSSVFSLQPLVDESSVVSGHQDGSLRLWDISRSPTCTHTLEKHHTAHITSIQNSPRTSYHILTSSKDNTLTIVDLRNFEVLRTFKAPQFRVSCEWSRASYSPDGNFVAAGGADGSVFIWNASTGNIFATLRPAEAAATAPSTASHAVAGTAVTAVHWATSVSGGGGLVAADKHGVISVWK